MTQLLVFSFVALCYRKRALRNAFARYFHLRNNCRNALRGNDSCLTNKIYIRNEMIPTY